MLDIRGKLEIEKEQKLGRPENLSETNHFPEDHTVNQKLERNINLDNENN